MIAAELDVSELQERFEGADPRHVLKWTFQTVPRAAIAISMQAGGVALVHMAREFTDRVPVMFVNTGFHFAETIEFRDRIVREWDIDLIEAPPTLGPERQGREIHPELWRVNPDRCCHLNRVMPARKIKENLDGWVTSIRRNQTAERAATPVVSWEKLPSGHRLLKICPMVTWTSADVWRYVEDHDLPVHPLYEQGYLSIGCAPCTRPVRDGEDERAGRWDGSDKTECGLHLADALHPADVSKPMDAID